MLLHDMFTDFRRDNVGAQGEMYCISLKMFQNFSSDSTLCQLSTVISLYRREQRLTDLTELRLERFECQCYKKERFHNESPSSIISPLLVSLTDKYVQN